MTDAGIEHRCAFCQKKAVLRVEIGGLSFCGSHHVNPEKPSLSRDCWRAVMLHKPLPHNGKIWSWVDGWVKPYV